MIADRDALTDSAADALALDCIESGIRAAHPGTVLTDALSLAGDRLAVGDQRYDLSEYGTVLVLGGGNAAGHVAAALSEVLGDALSGGVVVTDDPVDASPVAVLEGSHPLPDETGVAHTRRVRRQAREADADTLVLAVVTGGASSLLAAPADGVPLDALRETTRALLEHGADIHDVNAVRKHLSAVKGGRLARAAAPATVVGVAFSDVVDNDPSVIGSGPTVPDESTYEDALAVLEQTGVDAPTAVTAHLRAGARGEHPETPTAGDAAFADASFHVLCDNMTALAAARDVAADRGYETLVLSSRVRGEAREVGTVHVGVAEECLATGTPLEPPAVVLSGGEATVAVDGDGTGGPNLEFALGAALAAADPEITVAAVDTDGIDGATAAAGALVDAATASPESAARAALADNDALPFLDDRDAVIRTGQTGTNVNDLRVLVVE